MDPLDSARQTVEVLHLRNRVAALETLLEVTLRATGVLMRFVASVAPGAWDAFGPLREQLIEALNAPGVAGSDL